MFINTNSLHEKPNMYFKLNESRDMSLGILTQYIDRQRFKRLF